MRVRSSRRTSKGVLRPTRLEGNKCDAAHAAEIERIAREDAERLAAAMQDPQAITAAAARMSASTQGTPATASPLRVPPCVRALRFPFHDFDTD